MATYVYKCFLCDELVSYTYDDTIKHFEVVSCERPALGRGACGGSAYLIERKEE